MQGESIVASGKVERFGERLCMTSPDYLLPARSADRIPGLDLCGR